MNILMSKNSQQDYGISQLKASYAEERGLRHPITTIYFLNYNLVIMPTLSHVDEDLEWSDKALQKALSIYPNGFWFLFFKGRLEFVQGNLESCVDWYTKAWKNQDMRQFHQLCFWELMWVHCVLFQWQDALGFAQSLVKEAHYSKALYTYQQAVTLMMTGPDDSGDVDNLMKQVPHCPMRNPGKPMPIETFVMEKADRYSAQGNRLVLPALELIYVWNLFKIFEKREDLAAKAYKMVEEEEKRLQEEL